jgi:hypothetical protein
MGQVIGRINGLTASDRGEQKLFKYCFGPSQQNQSSGLEHFQAVRGMRQRYGTMLPLPIFPLFKMGVAKEKDIEEPLYTKSYASLEDARAGHSAIVDLVVTGRIPRGDDSA